MTFKIGDEVAVKYKMVGWRGRILDVMKHESGDNYYIESETSFNRGWYGSHHLKQLISPNNIMKELL